MISRREAFSLLGLAAALGFAVPITLLMGANAEAQAPAPAPTAAPAPTGGTMGMQRRSKRGALVAMSGARSGALVAMNGARSGAEVAKPHSKSSLGRSFGPRHCYSALIVAARAHYAVAGEPLS